MSRWIRRKLYPFYPCELCVGQESWAGCWCQYHGAYSPGDQVPPPWWVRLGRRIWKER